ncbi:hypothetical protein Pelo_911 [Pelomyxa schiedti]|nr:hypothetical protein Pelo_911 [Pelomyxa schiedti]
MPFVNYAQSLAEVATIPLRWDSLTEVLEGCIPACMYANGSYWDCAGLEEKLLQMFRSAEELLVLTIPGYKVTFYGHSPA